MIQQEIEIINKLGLHARAAAKLVAAAAHFSSNIQIGKDDQLVDAKSIMSVMLLAASKGTVLNVEISGNDEQEAWQAIETLIQNRFEEAE
ncbi:MAG: HPr family phosphocarrier protein [Pseudomonadota bacterium]